MKKIILISFLSFFITSISYSQFLGKSVFKNNEEVDIDKFFKLDISKYKITDVKILLGDEYSVRKSINKNNNKEQIYYDIFLKKDNKKYRLSLGTDEKSSVTLNLLLFDYTLDKNKSHFKNCTEIKNKYEKQYGKLYRYSKYNVSGISEKVENLKFQINSSNHTIELDCMSWESEVSVVGVENKNKKNSIFMEEISKITCTFNKQRIEHRYSNASNNSYMVIENLDKKETSNLYIDEYSKTIGRALDYNYEIQGEYKIFSKDKIQVIEDKGKESKIIWTLNRINGDIETYFENSNSGISHLIADRKAKSTRYGDCQKTKGNVL